jgi:NADH-quinone oxidoreductase subunit C
MIAEPGITDLEQLKDRSPIPRLLAWNPAAVTGAKFDRGELTLYIDRQFIREVCAVLRADAEEGFNFLSDVTCVDWYPAEPRFEVVYHLLSQARKQRLRLKVRLGSDDPRLDSITSVWPAANFFEREVFDLFGIQFEGHPYLRRIMMPEDWEGHPLRKDYPVEGYR